VPEVDKNCLLYNIPEKVSKGATHLIFGVFVGARLKKKLHHGGVAEV
jgi:hypothetical protein